MAKTPIERAVGWLDDSQTDVGRAIEKLTIAKENTPPPYKDEIRQQIKALESLGFCLRDLAAQLRERRPAASSLKSGG